MFYFSFFHCIIFIFTSICRLDNAIADTIATMIIDTFPSEATNTYYIPSIKKKDSPNNKSIPARGKLISMWRNRQCQYKKLLLNVTDKATTANDQSNEAGKIIFCVIRA